ncbi:MAG: ABC transporter substrate-binding protein [Desulfobacterales bacterium]|nr:ABC transporter substrate-binding protein [Desulfobacterales bacterium]
MKNITTGIVSALTLTAIAVICCYFIVTKQADFPTTQEPLSIGISKSFLSIPVYIAQAKGFFAEEGIDITINEYTSGKMATKKLFDGEVNISTVADIPVVFNSFKRNDFSITATFAASYHFVRMIARKDKGIKTTKDLKGKKIGTNMKTTSHFFLGTFLTHNLLPISDVIPVHYKTTDLPTALANDEVDAISVWQPYDHKAWLLLGKNAVEMPNKDIYRATFSFASMNHFAENNGARLEKFLKAINKAAIFTQTNKEESQEIITGIFKIDKEYIRKIWDTYVFGIFLDQSLLLGLDDVARWAIENRFTEKKKIPNYLDYLHLDALQTVKPESISIIR